MKIVVSQSIQLSDIDRFALEIVKHLSHSSVSPFVIKYQAGMGVGKTTLTRAILYAFGLDRREPVTSPTFAYVNEYVIDSKMFAHLDLYRLESLEDLTEILGRPVEEYFGIFIEWPEKAEHHVLRESHVLSGEIVDDLTRKFTLKSV